MRVPEHVDTHPLGCHNPRIGDRIIFDKLVQVAVLGAAYDRIADSICSATTIRRRRDEWITAGIFQRLEQIRLESHDRIVGLNLADVTVDGCIVKAPFGGGAAGKFPVDRGKQGTKRSRLDHPPLGHTTAPSTMTYLAEPLAQSTLQARDIQFGQEGFHFFVHILILETLRLHALQRHACKESTI